MKEKRHNINTIAEILIDKLNDLEHIAKRLEAVSKRASETVLPVDTKKLEELRLIEREERNSFLSVLRALNRKNNTRVPNWVLSLLGVLFLVSIGLSIYAWNKAEEYDLMKAKANHYENLYQELKKSTP